jgi:hypothetical protein
MTFDDLLAMDEAACERLIARRRDFLRRATALGSKCDIQQATADLDDALGIRAKLYKDRQALAAVLLGRA